MCPRIVRGRSPCPFRFCSSSLDEPASSSVSKLTVAGAQILTSLDHLGDRTAAHAFADDPFQKRTAALLEKAAKKVEDCGLRERACFN